MHLLYSGHVNTKDNENGEDLLLKSQTNCSTSIALAGRTEIQGKED